MSTTVRAGASPAIRLSWIGPTFRMFLIFALCLALPWLFYNYATGRHSGFMLTMFSQMGMMAIFALSYNMLMGQAGLLSFGHAVFFGLGGYFCIHLLNAAAPGGGLPVPIELLPLLAGLCAMIVAIVFGYMATRQRATAFAMITMGIGELVTTAAMMFHAFFGGEGGVSSDRMIDRSLFGLTYSQGVQVYYLIVAWSFISILAMFYLTTTPLGRMANACRDNYERVQFMGYDPKFVRFLQFALSGLFAGIAGGLSAITYEIVTFDSVSGALSANALLMVFIGGTNAFLGPILGAVLITLMQSGVSLISNSWLVYVGVLFIGMVTFAPAGLAGLVAMHSPLQQAGRLRRLIVPYVRIAVPGILSLIGFVCVVELLSYKTIGAAQGKKLELFGSTVDATASGPWLIAVGLFLVGGVWLWRESRFFHALWEQLMAEVKPKAVKGPAE
jgi:branched-chain amino acid transport system permease protein